MRVARRARAFGAGVLLGLAGVGTARGQGVHELRGEALRLYAAGRYQEALPLLDAVLRRKPNDLDLLNKRGCVYLRMNQPARALPDFDRATRYSPFLDIDEQQLGRQVAPDVPFPLTANPYLSPQLLPSPFTNRGIALLMLGRDDEALADFRHAIDLRRAYPLSWGRAAGLASDYCGLGQAYHHKGDDALALDAFDTAVRYNPNDPNGFVGRGEALAGLGRADEAVASYNQALRLDPNHARAYGFRASALERSGRPDAALADFETAIRLDPGWSIVRRMRGALLSRLERHEQALADFTEAIRLDPADAAAYKDRGGVYNRLGDPAKALRDLDEAIRLDPKSTKAYQNRAASYNGLARYEHAVRDCDEALRLDSENAGAWNNRGLALVGLGRYDRAVADLTESLRLDPRQVAAYVNRGGAYAQLGLLAEAASDYEEALRRAPKLAPAEAGLAQVRDLARLRGQSPSPSPTPTARDALAVRQAPSESARLCALGNSRRDAGDWRGAIVEFTRALEADPENADALASRGWSRLCGGEAGAEADARVWLDRKGWRDPFAPYMALLGVLAARREGHAPAAAAFLDEALANTRPPDWPAPLFRYLKRTTPSTDLLAAAAAGGPDRVAEARTVIALDLLGRGERTAAIEHLRWVRDHGPGRSIARDLARETLRRLGLADEPAPPPNTTATGSPP
jgi:tetratricopeptide (TPR) repeat protein